MTPGRIILLAALAMLVIWPPVIYLATTHDNAKPTAVVVCDKTGAGGVSPFDDC